MDRVRKMISIFLACIICITTIWGGNPANIQAAESYKRLELYDGTLQKAGATAFRYSKNGNYGYLYAVKNGRRTLLASGTGLGTGIITNGSTIYYVRSVPSAPYMKSTIYSIASNGKKNKKLFSIKDYSSIMLHGYYDNKIYYSYGELDVEKFCSYHVKKRKMRKLLTGVGGVRQQDQYFYIVPPDGDLWYLPLRVHNAKTGKTRTICKGQLGYNIISKKLYYADAKYSGSKGGRMIFTVSLKRSNLSGSNKKTLIKKLKVSSSVEIKKNSITYYDVNGKKKTKRL